MNAFEDGKKNTISISGTMFDNWLDIGGTIFDKIL